jgi:type IV pilus assembly protein PilY1
MKIQTTKAGIFGLLINLLMTQLVSATSIAQYPLFLTTAVPPIVMLNMGKDHKLYYEAYNDASDLDEDGVIDYTYKPDDISYYGYFDSFKCYNYSSGVFAPSSNTLTKKCGGNWSGDFLNYVTTSRMDALRKVLYGGFRSTDSTSSTILKRAFIPQDAHSWGKEYTSVAVNGYDISDFTPFALPTGGNRHLFANTTLNSENDPPLLRVLLNESRRIWEWVSIERPVAGNRVVHGGNGPVVAPTDYNVFVQACVSGLLESNCKAYSDGTTTTYKPTGLLQRYGDDELMAFGLLTGSYANNLRGGVLRKNIASFRDEIDLDTGIFTNVSGIVDTIDKLKIAGFNYNNHQHQSGFIFNRAINNGEAYNWGNPTAEMMYEVLRYFSGKTAGTSDFVYTSGADNTLGLPLPAWKDPYDTATGGYPYCAKPIQMVISDVNASYDTDQIPGSAFSSFGGDITGLNVSTLADEIWASEYGGERNIFIGQSGADSDGTPSAKTVTGFSNIRGLAPEEPTKLGGYYAGSLGLFGQENDVSSTAEGTQNIDTLAIALASPLPRIEVPLNGQIITLVPFGKSVGGCGPTATFQPTNTIVDFYVEDITPEITPTTYKFRINYEDAEQAADHDMDAIVEYTVEVINANQVKVDLNSIYAAGCVEQHMGYVISGTTADGTYLEVRDTDTNPGNDNDYFLDTPPGQLPGGVWNDGTHLPLTTSRTFTVGSSSSASFVEHDPLWYASKWSTSKGDPLDLNDGNDTILETNEWDGDDDGNPDGYFLVTNAGKLDAQLSKAFEEVVARTSSAAGVATNSTRLDSNTKVYQARFDSNSWKGELLAFNLNPADGTLADDDNDGITDGAAWDAGNLIPLPINRNIFSYDATAKAGILFEYGPVMAAEAGKLNAAQRSLLDKNYLDVPDSLGLDRVNFIRGDESKELHLSNGIFRSRLDTDDVHFVLGDIVNSDPWFSGRVEDFGYTKLADAEGEQYLTFRESKLSRTPTIYFGANDGMLHAINADDGDELFAYVPDAIIGDLNRLTSPLYGCSGQSNCIPHTYFVDGAPKVGDAYLSSDSNWHSILVGSTGGGGKSIFALDVTSPDSFSTTDILWEISTTTAPVASDLSAFQTHLGFTLPQSSIVKMQNGQWAAIVANGYESTNQTAVLFVIDIETGAIIREIDTGIGSGANPNGLSTPIPVDVNGDRITDAVYAGDLHGNMWKFDVSNSDVSQWQLAFGGSALYVALDDASTPNKQPISSKPQVGPHPDGGVMVYFGTGKYYEVGDQVVATPPKEQTFYAIRDTGSNVTSRTTLQAQVIQFEERIESLKIDVRVTSETTVDYTSKSGWYIDLVSPEENGGNGEGERVVSAPLLRGGRIIFTTMIPEGDPCGFGGSSWLMELDAVNGRRLDNAPFDIDQDGDFDNDDLLATIDSNGDGVIDENDSVNISGIRRDDVGIIKTPGVVSTGNNTEVKYVSGTSGKLEVFFESAGEPFGRQSWRQLR